MLKPVVHGIFKPGLEATIIVLQPRLTATSLQSGVSTSIREQIDATPYRS
ncbi:hypothetical protein [Nostoc sp. UHCC 0251]|nr:hypothetical protein [Nostoc sp. UHCC 0251]MEA5625926.1 hypothetical protein [Nostoc sp. UHCC 0251]